MSELHAHQLKSMVGVVTVDDQTVFPQAARAVIEATEGFEILGQACSGEEALVLVDEVDPDLILVDVRMPGMNGIETAARLSALHPAATIVLVSSDEREGLPAEAERCGAAAYLAKEQFGAAALRRLGMLHDARVSRRSPR